MKTKINALIVDDEPACIRCLEKDLACYPYIRIVATASSAKEAVKAIIKKQPDLLFLDIEIGKATGFDILKAVRDSVQPNMQVVFYSAHDQYLLDALRASAFDFLLKPYLLEELDMIIQRIKTQIGEGKTNLWEESLQKILLKDRKFAIQSLKSLVFVQDSEVLYFEYIHKQRFWQLCTTDRDIYQLRSGTNAKELTKLHPSFIQISQNFIVNTNYLLSIENGSYQCMFIPPFQEIEVYASRRFYSKAKDILGII